MIQTSTAEPIGVLVEYFCESRLVSTLIAASIEEAPDILDVDGVTYRAVSHIRFGQVAGRWSYHVIAVAQPA